MSGNLIPIPSQGSKNQGSTSQKAAITIGMNAPVKVVALFVQLTLTVTAGTAPTTPSQTVSDIINTFFAQGSGVHTKTDGPSFDYLAQALRIRKGDRFPYIISDPSLAAVNTDYVFQALIPFNGVGAISAALNTFPASQLSSFGSSGVKYSFDFDISALGDVNDTDTSSYDALQVQNTTEFTQDNGYGILLGNSSGVSSIFVSGATTMGNVSSTEASILEAMADALTGQTYLLPLLNADKGPAAANINSGSAITRILVS